MKEYTCGANIIRIYYNTKICRCGRNVQTKWIVNYLTIPCSESYSYFCKCGRKGDACNNKKDPWVSFMNSKKHTTKEVLLSPFYKFYFFCYKEISNYIYKQRKNKCVDS